MSRKLLDEEEQEAPEHVPTTAALDHAVLESAPEPADVTSLGKSIELLSDRKLTLNAEAAYKHLELSAFENERPLDSRWVAHLKQAIDRGTFRPELVTLASARCDELDKDLRVNGQHTCWAVIEAGVEFDVRAVKYRCKTAYDFRQLYSSFDRGKARSTSHVVMSYLGGAPELSHLRGRVIPNLVAGLAIYLWEGGEQRTHDADERCFLLLSKHLDLALKVGELLQTHQNADARAMYRKGTVGAMFATFNKAVHDSQEFWGKVLTGVGATNVSDPTLRLRTYIQRLKRAGISTAERLTLSEEEIYRACLLAWNAYREGRPLQAIRPTATASRPRVK